MQTATQVGEIMAGQQTSKQTISGAKGFGIVMGAMIGIIAALWLLAWALS